MTATEMTVTEMTATEMTKPAPPVWRVVVSMFTIIPAGGTGDVGPDVAARAVRLLPVLGALLGGVGAVVMFAAEAAGQSEPRRLLAAVLAIGALGVLTGGLHLDGLADTADGLGSRLTGQQALEVMRRSDIGPMGAAALLFVVLAQVSALAAVQPGWHASVALITAAATSRVAVLLAAAEPAARPDGFGALIAGSIRPGTRIAAVAVLLVAATAAAAAAAGPVFAGSCAGAVLAGLVAAFAICRIARHRLGGTSGDVFGAIIETSVAVALIVLALSG
jgi:adenosylcobinamide-GDP ribazoletransferase